ncbi:hypothetical protein RHP75_04795 [Pseudomonas sp. SG20056]|uniref:hypothetical protein n=1 Tax=Pseudomonas sp. SG20056 TaxID=3074146 RepID=UPI00287F937B|nr:hypothetical protein [Pseudomonas sp. SG20056]WNF47761.1 hypothetical protein RHP75_04795 [Pseudomonas sp. SG20056]
MEPPFWYWSDVPSLAQMFPADDYLLFVGGNAAGVIEVQKADISLSKVAEQSASR